MTDEMYKEIYPCFTTTTTDGKEYITVFKGENTGDCEDIVINTPNIFWEDLNNIHKK